MIKAVDFLDYLCNTLGYRFFSGMPCCGLKPLYNSMNSDFMYYIPAVREDIALGLVSGASVSGEKSCILIHYDYLNNILNWINDFNFKHKIPFLVIVYSDNGIDIPLKASKVVLGNDFKKDLNSISYRIDKQEKPGFVIIKEGLLK